MNNDLLSATEIFINNPATDILLIVLVGVIILGVINSSKGY